MQTKVPHRLCPWLGSSSHNNASERALRRIVTGSATGSTAAASMLGRLVPSPRACPMTRCRHCVLGDARWSKVALFSLRSMAARSGRSSHVAANGCTASIRAAGASCCCRVRHGVRGHCCRFRGRIGRACVLVPRSAGSGRDGIPIHGVQRGRAPRRIGGVLRRSAVAHAICAARRVLYAGRGIRWVHGDSVDAATSRSQVHGPFAVDFRVRCNSPAGAACAFECAIVGVG